MECPGRTWPRSSRKYRLLNKEKLHQSSEFGAQGLFKLLRRFQKDSNLYQSMLRLESNMNRKIGADLKKIL